MLPLLSYQCAISLPAQCESGLGCPLEGKDGSAGHGVELEKLTLPNQTLNFAG